MFSYQSMIVYQRAKTLNKTIFRYLYGSSNLKLFVKDQLGRASLSIVLNIAEGSSRFSMKDRRHFFVIARGSVFECAAIVDFLLDENELDEQSASAITRELENVSQQLYQLIKHCEK